MSLPPADNEAYRNKRVDDTRRAIALADHAIEVHARDQEAVAEWRGMRESFLRHLSNLEAGMPWSPEIKEAKEREAVRRWYDRRRGRSDER